MTLDRAVTWVPPSFLAARVAKTSSYLAVGGDSGKLIDFTSAGTLTLTAAATLGNSWRLWVYNSSSGLVPIDPNGSETIRVPAGTTTTTMILAPGESVLLMCTGTAFEAIERVHQAFNVMDFGAKGDGTTDDTAAIQAAAAAVQANGGGTLFFPPRVYIIFTSTTGTLCAFSNLTGIACLGYGATLQVYTSKVITASEGFLFGFSGCKNILVDGFTTNGPTLDVSSTTVKGYQFVNCQSGCRNLSMPNNRVKNSLAGLLCEKLLADPDTSRTQNIHVGVLDVVNCWYGISGIYSGDFMRVDCLRTDTIHRSCFIYGASNLDLTIYSKDCVGSSDVPLATKSGVAMTDVRVNYFCTTDTQASLVAPKVKLSFSDQTPGLLRNIFVNLNVAYNATGDTGGAALFIEKLTNAGSPDSSDRGHKLQNLTITGTVTGTSSYNDGGSIITDPLATWGTGDYFSNIALENLRIEGTSGVSTVVLTLGNCVDQILVKNFYSNYALVIRNGATGDLRLPFVATTLLENVVCSNRWAYDGTYQPIDNIRATGASETVRAGWTGHSISNLGAGSTMTWTLPAAVVGLEYMFQRQDAQTMNIDPNGAEVIRGYGAGVAVTLANAGEYLHLKCYIAGTWEIVSSQGAGIFTTLKATGLVSFGTGAGSSGTPISAQYDDGTQPTLLQFKNGTAGTGTYAALRAVNNSGSVAQILIFSSTYTTLGALIADRAGVTTSATAGLVLCAFTASAPIVIAPGGTAEMARYTGGTIGTDYYSSLYTLDSTSISTGSAVYAGGVGITKNLYVGGNTNIAGTLLGYLAGMVVESGTTFTFSQATHGGRVVITTNGSAVTATVPVTLPVGFNCTLIQGGAGQVTVASDGSSVVVGYLSQLKTAAQYAYTVLSVPQTIGTAIFGGTTA